MALFGLIGKKKEVEVEKPKRNYRRAKPVADMSKEQLEVYLLRKRADQDPTVVDQLLEKRFGIQRTDGASDLKATIERTKLEIINEALKNDPDAKQAVVDDFIEGTTSTAGKKNRRGKELDIGSINGEYYEARDSFDDMVDTMDKMEYLKDKLGGGEKAEPKSTLGSIAEIAKAVMGEGGLPGVIALFAQLSAMKAAGMQQTQIPTEASVSGFNIQGVEPGQVQITQPVSPELAAPQVEASPVVAATEPTNLPSTSPIEFRIQAAAREQDPGQSAEILWELLLDKFGEMTPVEAAGIVGILNLALQLDNSQVMGMLVQYAESPEYQPIFERADTNEVWANGLINEIRKIWKTRSQELVGGAAANG